MYAIFKTLILACAALFLIGISAAQESLSPKNSFIAPPADKLGSLNCEKPKLEIITIPAPLVPKAELKARLIQLLRESLEDDSQGKTDLKKEKEIKELARKVQHD